MLDTSPIPDDVQAFIAAHITSAIQLEALLLLAEKAPTAWTAAEVVTHLRAGTTFVSTTLTMFESLGLLRAEMAEQDPLKEASQEKVCYRYQPAVADQGRTVEALARAYRERRDRVLAAIYSPRS